MTMKDEPASCREQAEHTRDTAAGGADSTPRPMQTPPSPTPPLYSPPQLNEIGTISPHSPPILPHSQLNEIGTITPPSPRHLPTISTE